MNEFVSGSANSIYCRSLTATDQSASQSAAPGLTINDNSAGGGTGWGVNVWTNTSQQIACRSNSASTTIRISSLGWFDTQGRQ